MSKEIHGAGVQPIAFHNDEIYFLLGQERYDKGWKDSNKYSSFGGKREKGESVLDAAVREGYEESMGFLGTETDIRKQLKKGSSKFIGTIEEYAHRTYLYEIPYDPFLPKQFKDVYQYSQKCGRKNLDKVCPKGLWEKKGIKWFSSREMARLAYTDWKKDGQKVLRWTFAMTVGKMLSVIRNYQKVKSPQPKKVSKKPKKVAKKPKKVSRKPKKVSRKPKKVSKKPKKISKKPKKVSKKRKTTSRKRKKVSRKRKTTSRKRKRSYK